MARYEAGESSNTSNCINLLEALNEGCVTEVLSRTSPLDASRMAIVSHSFQLAVDSDGVWLRFLPPDVQEFINRGVPQHDNTNKLLALPSQKKKYLFLSANYILIDGGAMSFSIDRLSGKKCFMVSARHLTIVWSDTPTYRRWISDPHARFEEVAELLAICWFEIHGRINTSWLSPNTAYKAYLIYKPISEEVFGFDEYQKVLASVGVVGEESDQHIVYLDPIGEVHHRNITGERDGSLRVYYCPHYDIGVPVDLANEFPKIRKDRWLEVELGDYFCGEGENKELEVTLMKVRSGQWKSGLIIQGIELRPANRGDKHLFQFSDVCGGNDVMDDVLWAICGYLAFCCKS